MWTQGIVATDVGEVFAKPGMKPDELRAAKLPFLEAAGFTDSDYDRVDFGPVTVNGYEVFVDVLFRRGRVNSFGLNLSSAMSSRLFGMNKPLNDRVMLLKSWIEEQTGHESPATFPWGEIGVTVDHWTSEVSIYFKYA